MQAMKKRTLQTISLPYDSNSHDLAAKLQDLSWFAYLDSCHSTGSRFDIITALPYQTLITQQGRTTCTHTHDQKQTISHANPLTLLDTMLSPIPTENALDLPFLGGAMGFLGYGLGQYLEPTVKLQNGTHKQTPLPDMAIGLYDWAIIVDHQKQKTYCVFGDVDPLIDEKTQSVLDRLHQPNKRMANSFSLTSHWQSNLSLSDYTKIFSQIKNYILAGDCYQANLTQHFSAHFTGDPWVAYCKLRSCNPSPFSAFLRYPDYQIACLSPERFLSVNQQDVITQPIKGTIARASDPRLDRHNATALLNSTKDKAENIMIVDLLRNDLSKHCQKHSVKVDELFQLASYTSVHHLVSTIRATLSPHIKMTDLLADCFPGGSITGAPKIRAMQILDECEPHHRGVYCGSIGYLSSHRMDFNIAIRTLTFHNHQVSCPAGGAIVADSVVDQEYKECFDKVSAIFKAFNDKL